MSLLINRFAVYGLHGKFDIDIPIYDNRLILVGVNGLGKTTVVNLIYFLLTAQWGRLLEAEFASIAICVNGQDLEVSRQDIQSKSNLSDRFEKVFARFAARSPFSPRMIQKVFTHPAYQSILDLPPSARAKAARDLSRDLDLPTTYVARLLDELPRSVTDDLFESGKDSPAISEFLSVMKEAGNQKVIYLPTFRRIEQDLKSIFPNLDEDELRKLTSRSSNALNPRNRGHVELVQFGMHDVETKIAEELEAIRERTRSQLTNLTASYLKDIISNRADSIETDLLRQMDDRLVTGVLDRVEENTLSQQDKLEVRLAIGRIKSGGSVFEARDKYLAYFFSRLLEIYITLAESEKNIRGLVTTCNRYLERKHLRYNETAFTVDIVDADDSALSWKVLSSGEKQVASLFTHLYLSRDAEQIIIIDEPELSLSVQWQKSLLPDISDSTACRLLIAVTHSPFIYANKLDAYAVDLSKFITLHPRGTQN
jgi:predicted ATP-dependent endonuclease of OLD family